MRGSASDGVESKTGREILRCVAAHPEERDAGKNRPPLRLQNDAGLQNVAMI